MLSNKMQSVFLNNDVKQSEAKRRLFLKAKGYAGCILVVGVFIAFIGSFVALPRVVGRLSGEIRNAA